MMALTREVEISEDNVVFLDKLVADPVDVLRDVLAENRRLREALELAETAIRNGDHPELVLVHIQQALADIDAGRYATPQQSLEDSLKQMKKIRNGELPKTTWHEFKRELDAEDGDSD
ncbi:hypothetical protein ACOALA_13610 [Alicyclobacillus acidoterrestris]|uniref:hypothetical protein n=1 Tax=Alicyclobacillus acidoterrestris TaxID=1450 RepID=UPI003F530922